jgi:hypothetical protein
MSDDDWKALALVCICFGLCVLGGIAGIVVALFPN